MSGELRDEAGVRLVGYDREGNEQVTLVPVGQDATETESRLRAEGARVAFAQLMEPDRARPEGISAEDFARFNEMLASAVARGVPMLQGIRSLAQEIHKKRVRETLDRVASELERGQSAGAAFGSQATMLPRLYGQLIEAGIASGSLSEVLMAFARNIRTDATFRRTVLEASVYPIVLLVACAGVLSSFAAFILPKVVHIAGQVDMPIPLVTRILTAHDKAGQLIFGIVVTILLGLIAVWVFRLSRIELGRWIAERVARRAPFFRVFFEAAVWSSAADTLALLLRARVPAPAALRMVGPATGTDWLSRACERLAAEVEQGKPLSVAARGDRNVPYRVAQAFSVCESRNDMPSALRELAARYRNESERRARLVTQYLPPVFAVVMGVLIFVIALAMIGPYVRLWGAGW